MPMTSHTDVIDRNDAQLVRGASGREIVLRRYRAIILLSVVMLLIHLA